MDVRITEAELPGIKIIVPEAFEDDRGFFMESYHKEKLAELSVDLVFVQDNHSRSVQNVLRGFHYQDSSMPQWRLIRCTLGEIWDVVVDLRVGASTFGKWFGVNLSANNRKQILIRPEFAHGFAVLSEYAEVQYKCTNHYDPKAERLLSYNDSDIGVPWPIKNPIMSKRDKYQGITLKQYMQKPSFKI